jgi:hypothetical protein
VPSTRSASITILGAISADGVIDISLRKLSSTVASKKRKGYGREIKINGRVGTRSEHFLSYLRSMVNNLDRNGFHRYYLVMDNAPIYKLAKIREFLESRGYKCVYFFILIAICLAVYSTLHVALLLISLLTLTITQHSKLHDPKKKRYKRHQKPYYFMVTSAIVWSEIDPFIIPFRMPRKKNINEDPCTFFILHLSLSSIFFTPLVYI